MPTLPLDQTKEMFDDLPLNNRLNILIGQWMKRMKDLGELEDYLKRDYGFCVFECPDIVPEIEKELAKKDADFLTMLEGMKQDDRPEITEWLTSEKETRAYNQAISDMQDKVKGK